MSVYVNDVIVIVLDISEIEMVSTTLGEYEVVIRAMSNQEKSVDLQLSTQRGRSMFTNSVVRCWMEGLVKLLGVWFSEDHQVDKN